MARGKGTSGTKKVSAGVHSNVSSKTLNGIRSDVPPVEKFLNKFKAYLNGKNPWFTIENPNKEEKDKLFIRVRAVDLYGSIKNRKRYMIPGS